MFKLFMHTLVAGSGTNATVRGGSFLETELATVAEARKTATSILAMDPTVGRVTIHKSDEVGVFDTVVR
jgi:hypothetical protein